MLAYPGRVLTTIDTDSRSPFLSLANSNEHEGILLVKEATTINFEMSVLNVKSEPTHSRNDKATCTHYWLLHLHLRLTVHLLLHLRLTVNWLLHLRLAIHWLLHTHLWLSVHLLLSVDWLLHLWLHNYLNTWLLEAHSHTNPSEFRSQVDSTSRESILAKFDEFITRAIGFEQVSGYVCLSDNLKRVISVLDENVHVMVEHVDRDPHELSFPSWHFASHVARNGIEDHMFDLNFDKR
jgi:hypothetical protein